MTQALNSAIELRIASAKKKLANDYSKYVKNFSSPKMAISLEYASLLHALASDIAIEKALDLGSGFSTFVLLDTDVEVFSFDHDDCWAKTTDRFIGKEGFVQTLDAFENFEEQVDLISCDTGGLQRRIDMLPRCYELLAMGGCMLIDDMHKPKLRPIYGILDDLGADLFDVKSYTLDRFGRFAVMAQKT